jgi:hypothetical protein
MLRTMQIGVNISNMLQYPQQRVDSLWEYCDETVLFW